MSQREQLIGLCLALSSSIFIGASFIVKKRGLRIAAAQGLRAGAGGFSYLKEPVWWAGMMSMVIGEAANFAAYAFAPAILVTPLGALSIIVSAVLAHIVLQEKLNMFGSLGCLLCITGSLTIVLHAPPERQLNSVIEVFQLAMQPAFLGYAVFSVCVIIFLILFVAPQHGTTNIFVYLGICSLAGSLSVMSCKALGIALKLTFQGDNQLLFGETYVCISVVVVCVMTQMNYLNKALDLFNTAIVSPVYYVMFTLLTILASIIMFRDVQSVEQVLTEGCGFVTIVAGTFLLHATKDLDVTVADLGRLLKDKDTTIGILSPSSAHPHRRALLDLDEGTPMLVHSVDVEGPSGVDAVLGSSNGSNGRKLMGSHLPKR
ncbi:hypothetical protein Vretimale_5487 [Volvox reticuliferus]|uniref:Probable magnesium transporter n=1 Tax=Volvox reticuliferus TaxID=1737510 RepID=A0A8J4FF23_9CHLO|nr:hypothetical protein Vretifemale_3788 [Volvox reticuliferus]GIM00344.1 hypothetical protein Vretimale_5487 [Volvox reticuliferus]